MASLTLHAPTLVTGGATIWVRNRYLPATALHFLDVFRRYSAKIEP